MRKASLQEAGIMIVLIVSVGFIVEHVPMFHSPEAGAATAPMLMVDGRPLLSVRVNGRGPYQMVLDTGAGNTAVSPDWLDGKAEQTRIHLQIGARDYKDFAASSFSLPRGFPKGVLCAEAFPGELVTLDFPKKTVTFQQGSLPRADGRRIFQYEAGDRLPTVPIRVGGREMRVVVDSGNAKGLTLPLRLAKEIPLASSLVPAGNSGILIQGGGTREVAQFSAALTGTVELGEYTLNAPEVTFRDQPDPWSGNFGDEILRTFKVTIDARNRRLLFER